MHHRWHPSVSLGNVSYALQVATLPLHGLDSAWDRSVLSLIQDKGSVKQGPVPRRPAMHGLLAHLWKDL